MRLPFAVLALLFAASVAADPVYLDQLMETPLATLQQQFPGLKKDGCYRVADGRYVLLDISRKEGKPWRVALTDTAPCKRPEDLAAALDVRHRKGVERAAPTPRPHPSRRSRSSATRSTSTSAA
jgi:hypothetical protein